MLLLILLLQFTLNSVNSKRTSVFVCAVFRCLVTVVHLRSFK